MEDMTPFQAEDAETGSMRSARVGNAAFGLAAVALASAAVLAAQPAFAQSRAGFANEFSRPYDLSPTDMTRPYDARTRDLNGNRVIIDGRIVVGDDLSSLPLGLYNSSGGLGFSGTGVAIGNQLNVNTSGSFNTVIVNSTQVNNGDQTVVLNGTPPSPPPPATPGGSPKPFSPTVPQELNGGLNF